MTPTKAISKKETTEQQSDVVTISLTKDEACICLKGLGRLENETSPLEGEEKELYDKLSKFTD